MMRCILSKTLFLTCIALSVLFVHAQSSYAVSYLIDDTGGGCIELSGIWDATTLTCTVNKLSIGEEDALVINGSSGATPVSLVVEGLLKNRGSISIRPQDVLRAKGRVSNEGSIGIRGTLFNEVRLINRGILGIGSVFSTLINSGWLYNDGILIVSHETAVVDNEVGANLINNGLIDIDVGSFRSFGVMRNNGHIEVSAGSIVSTSSLTNEEGGTFNNNGTIDIRSKLFFSPPIMRFRFTAGTVSNLGLFKNFGAIQVGQTDDDGLLRNQATGKIRNAGEINVPVGSFIINNGIINNKCDGMIDLQGTLMGNPINEDCNP